MTWFKVDDGFSTHAKVDDLGDDQAIAVAAWTLCGSACMRDLTDGHVTPAALRRTLAAWTPKDRERAAAALVRVGLWDAAEGGGWLFRNWLEHQPSREHVERERALAKERQKRAREKRSTVTHGDVTPSVTNEVTRDVQRESRRDESVSHAAPTRPDPTRPDQGESESPPAPEVEPVGLPGQTGAPWRTLIEPIRSAILEWSKTRKVAAPREAALGNEHAALAPIARWLWETGEAQGWSAEERVRRCRWLVLDRFYASKDARTVAKGYPLGWLAANPAEYALDAKRGAA